MAVKARQMAIYELGAVSELHLTGTWHRVTARSSSGESGMVAAQHCGLASDSSAAKPRADALACHAGGAQSCHVAAPRCGTMARSHIASDAGLSPGDNTNAIAVGSTTGMTSRIGDGNGLS